MAPNTTVTTVVRRNEKKSNGIEKDPCSSTQNPKYQSYFGEFETELKWVNIISIFIVHIMALYICVTYPYFQKKISVPYGFLIGGLGGFGVTAGAHRYYTHRSYKANIPLQIILLICYSIAGQNTIPEWVKDHRVHHKFSETDADPHNSNRGFFFAHVGWLMMKKHPDVIRKGKTIDMSDITEDPLIKFHTKYFISIKIFFCFFLPTIIPMLLWDEIFYYSFMSGIFRYVLNLNFTWFVNSAAHIWGYKPYDTSIKPVENWSVSLVAMGEGWHNYHHTFPWDYRAAELGRVLNVTTFWLDMFAKIGWAYDLKCPSQDLVQKMAENHGDGTHWSWGHQEVPIPKEDEKKKL